MCIFMVVCWVKVIMQAGQVGRAGKGEMKRWGHNWYTSEGGAFFSSVIDLDLDGKKYPVVVRDLQRHPFKPLVTHVDFMRIDAKQEITMHVPLHVANAETCKGVKDEDGELHLLTNDVEISCLPKDLPDYLEVDVAELSVGAVLHLSDISLPKGVTIVALAREEVHDNAILI